jgi:hypothetical protein
MVSRIDDPNNFGRWAETKIGSTESMVKNIVDTGITEGASVMREIISNQGTNRDWGASWPSRAQGRKSGSTKARFDTGQMLNAVDSKIVESSPGRAVGEFGWLNEQEKYFIYQDNGFEHWISHDSIPAMNALRNAYTYAIYVVETEIQKVFRK